MKNILMITTGTKKEVFRDTWVLSMVKESKEKIHVTILTNEDNLGIFEDIRGFPNKVYPLNASSFLILKDKHFDDVFNYSREELGEALANNFICFSDKLLTYHPQDYYFEKATYPYDVIHQAIRSKGKCIVGINIGEDEDVSKKLPLEFLTTMMNKINNSLSPSFVLFGSNSSTVRANSISRTVNVNIINMIGLNNPKQLAQAIELCDVLVSLDSFTMLLSIAIGQNTIGLFANTKESDLKSYRHLRKISTKFDNSNCISQCVNQREKCPILYSITDGENCLYHFDNNEIINAIYDFDLIEEYNEI